MMKLREWDAKEFALAPDLGEMSAAYFEKYGFGYTALAPEGIVGSAGLTRIVPGNWEAWAYTTDLFPKYGIRIHRLARSIIDGFFASDKVRRIQCLVDSGNLDAVRWAYRLFDDTVLLEKYGSEGQDFFMFSKVKG